VRTKQESIDVSEFIRKSIGEIVGQMLSGDAGSAEEWLVECSQVMTAQHIWGTAKQLPNSIRISQSGPANESNIEPESLYDDSNL
jgi:hypothetical protein